MKFLNVFKNAIIFWVSLTQEVVRDIKAAKARRYP